METVHNKYETIEKQNERLVKRLNSYTKKNQVLIENNNLLYSQYEEEINIANIKLELANSEIKELEQKNKLKKDTVTSLKNEMYYLRQSVKIQKEINELISQRDTIKEQNKILKEQYSELNNKNTGLKKSNTILTKKINKQKYNPLFNSKKITFYEKELDGQQNEINSLRRSLNNKKRIIEELDTNLEIQSSKRLKIESVDKDEIDDVIFISLSL
jgi:uncharacterized protein (DUF3084 family)